MTFQHRAGVSPYTSPFGFAETCVFDKQSPGPFHCGLLAEAPLLPKLRGKYRNVVDFGVFVDCGVHEDGLVHISKISKKHIKHPLDVVSVGQIVTVWVVSVDLRKNRLELTMIDPSKK